MADYEKILLSELGMHHLRTPNELLVPGQVQIRRGNLPFGRFTLDDVFDGDFTGVSTGAPARMADIERTSSNAYAIDGSATLTGPLSWIARARGSIGATGAKHVQLTALTGEIVELDQGALQRALHGATARMEGPLDGDSVAVVVVAVASVKEFSVKFDDDRGASVALDASAAEGLTAELGLSAKSTSAGGLSFSLDKPVPFAARVWRVERKLLGRRLSIGTFRGPVELLGEGVKLDPDFVAAVGLVEDAIDLPD
ncbi:hypothetical protein [Sphingomonas sp.]|uniref:hypothetical protein n=1 Tax=Sphingomonas sp. TaxID=28214 RepID=UPI002DD63944|nr:hypothetical protein [Sphingomonas sp.]